MLLIPKQRTLSIGFEIVPTSASGNASANQVLRRGLPRFRGAPSCSGVRSPSPIGACSSLDSRVIIPTPLRAARRRLAMRFVTIQSFPWTIGLATPVRGVTEGRQVTTVTVPWIRRLGIRVTTGHGVLPVAARRRGSSGHVLVSRGSGDAKLAERGMNDRYHHQVSGIRVLHHALFFLCRHETRFDRARDFTALERGKGGSYRKGSGPVARRVRLRGPLRTVVGSSRTSRAWRRVVATRLERVLVDGTASIPGLGLPERSSIFSRASVGSGRADRPERV